MHAVEGRIEKSMESGNIFRKQNEKLIINEGRSEKSHNTCCRNRGKTANVYKLNPTSQRVNGKVLRLNNCSTSCDVRRLSDKAGNQQIASRKNVRA